MFVPNDLDDLAVCGHITNYMTMGSMKFYQDAPILLSLKNKAQASFRLDKF